MSEETPVNNDQKQEQQFAIQRVYIKDFSFESPMGPQAFLLEKQPAISQDLSTEINAIADGLFETVLCLTITAKVEDKTIFLVEIQQAGLFAMTGIVEPDLGRVLNTVCLQVLFPYLREAIDSTLIKATFPPLMLPPINFDALYAQALKDKAAKAH